jgi:hypothetical protein
MSATLFPSVINQYNENFTTLTMSSQENGTRFLRRFNKSKRQAEEAGLSYTEDFTVELFLGITNTANRHECSINTNIHLDKRGSIKNVDCTDMETSFLNLDKHRLIADQAKFT